MTMKRPLKLVLDKPFKEEADLLKEALKWLYRQRDLKVLRICTEIRYGYSDLFLCVRGHFVIIELKDDEGTLTAPQEEFIVDMKDVGAIGGECRTVQQIIDYVNSARQKMERINNG